MKNRGWAALAVILMVGVLSACGSKGEVKDSAGGTKANSTAVTTSAGESKSSGSAESGEMRTITYLDKTYTVPAKAQRIVITGSIESMEDALVLDVTPTGAITVGGKFPSLFTKITEGTVGIGEKTQPDLEGILKLKPDVILASTKFPAETLEKFAKISTTIPVSHISSDWEKNLNLLAELTGKQAQAKQLLEKYKSDLAEVRKTLNPVFKDKKVLAIRIRKGSICIYPQNVFFNPSIYEELGASVPDEVAAAKAQQLISLEKFSEINPDYVFIQFSEDENKETPKAFEELQNNPIWKSVNAVKNGHVYTNLVDPLTQGGTAYSKFAFLEALKNSTLMQAK